MDTETLDKIPTEEDWLEKPDTIMESYISEFFIFRDELFGKSWKDIDAKYYQSGSSIERASDLTYAPRRIFQYYVQPFAAYLLSDAAKSDPDAASTFLNMIETRLGSDYHAVIDMYAQLGKCVDFISAGQDWFDARIEIYGSFSDRTEHIRQMVSHYQQMLKDH